MDSISLLGKNGLWEKEHQTYKLFWIVTELKGQHKQLT